MNRYLQLLSISIYDSNIHLIGYILTQVISLIQITDIYHLVTYVHTADFTLHPLHTLLLHIHLCGMGMHT
jgi:hypothetical protein